MFTCYIHTRTEVDHQYYETQIAFCDHGLHTRKAIMFECLRCCDTSGLYWHRFTIYKITSHVFIHHLLCALRQCNIWGYSLVVVEDRSVVCCDHHTWNTTTFHEGVTAIYKAVLWWNRCRIRMAHIHTQKATGNIGLISPDTSSAAMICVHFLSKLNISHAHPIDIIDTVNPNC